MESIQTARNYSTNKFRKILGISLASFIKLDNDQAKPRTILALHEKFGIDPLWLITEKINSVIQSQNALKIGQFADTLSDETQNLILKIMQREALLKRILKDEKIDIPSNLLTDFGK